MCGQDDLAEITILGNGKKAVIIGAGLGGLAAACRLAKYGWSVTVLERTTLVGGKCSERNVNGYRFDTGPSLLTMKFVLEDLFSYCGARLDDFLMLKPVEPTCRYYFEGEKPVDLFSAGHAQPDLDAVAKEELKRFLAHSKSLWDKTADAFVFNPLYALSDLKHLKWIDLLSIDAFSTLAKSVQNRVRDRRLQLILKRFATYNGSDPWKTPGTLNVIPHVELSMGAFYPVGGLFAIPKALHKLAEKLGVTFHFETTVSGLKTNDKKDVTAVETENGSLFPCDVLISNADARWFYENLEPEAKKSSGGRFSTMEPSCSGFVILLGIRQSFPELQHHTIFFSYDYRKEFQDIFDRKIPAENPTIYIANTSFSDTNHAPANASNLFILVNAPFTSDEFSWTDATTSSYAKLILNELKNRGLPLDESKIDVLETITPQQFEQRYHTNRGSIYGYSSNSKWSAFLRPRNKVKHLNNVYLVGGSTHPGGGIPLVVTSAKHAHTLIKRFHP